MPLLEHDLESSSLFGSNKGHLKGFNGQLLDHLCRVVNHLQLVEAPNVFWTHSMEQKKKGSVKESRIASIRMILPFATLESLKISHLTSASASSMDCWASRRMLWKKFKLCAEIEERVEGHEIGRSLLVFHDVRCRGSVVALFPSDENVGTQSFIYQHGGSLCFNVLVRREDREGGGVFSSAC